MRGEIRRAAGLMLAACGLIGGRIGWTDAGAQTPGKEFVKATVTAPKMVLPGKPFLLTVAITVDKPYHIQGNPTKEGYIPTEVAVVPITGFTVGKVAYPAAKQMRFSGEMLPVYEGKIEVKVTVTAGAKAKPGSITLPITVKYQGCNETACYPPSSVKTQATLTLSAEKTPAKKADAQQAEPRSLLLTQQAEPRSLPARDERGGRKKS